MDADKNPFPGTPHPWLQQYLPWLGFFAFLVSLFDTEQGPPRFDPTELNG
jgi:hypothetical protein